MRAPFAFSDQLDMQHAAFDGKIWANSYEIYRENGPPPTYFPVNFSFETRLDLLLISPKFSAVRTHLIDDVIRRVLHHFPVSSLCFNLAGFARSSTLTPVISILGIQMSSHNISSSHPLSSNRSSNIKTRVLSPTPYTNSRRTAFARNVESVFIA